MPSSLIQHQQRMPAWRHSLTDCFQMKCHGLRIGIGQYQTHGSIALRADGAKEIGGVNRSGNSGGSLV
jgi:hypothetical protein